MGSRTDTPRGTRCEGHRSVWIISVNGGDGRPVSGPRPPWGPTELAGGVAGARVDLRDLGLSGRFDARKVNRCLANCSLDTSFTDAVLLSYYRQVLPAQAVAATQALKRSAGV